MRKLLIFLMLMIVWCIFSGQFDAFHLTLGVLSCAIVMLLTERYLFGNEPTDLKSAIAIGLRMIPYSIWLIKEIYLANVHVFLLAVSPRGMRHVNPMLLRFKTRLQNPVARYVLANSITLTPGTVTMKLVGDELYVHSISAKTTIGLEGDMEARIGHVFGESLTGKPQVDGF